MRAGNLPSGTGLEKCRVLVLNGCFVVVSFWVCKNKRCHERRLFIGCLAVQKAISTERAQHSQEHPLEKLMAEMRVEMVDKMRAAGVQAPNRAVPIVPS